MTDEDKKNLIESYVSAYNNFDVEGMTANLHDEIIFKNISNGELTLEIKGIDAFRNQAKQILPFFAEREQRIRDFVFSEDGCEAGMNYQATLAADLPNGFKAGDRLDLNGKSIFCFADGKIVEIQDIS